MNREELYYYNIDSPRIGKLLFQDDLFYYLSAINIQSTVDRIRKTDGIYKTKKELLDKAEKYCDNEIKILENKIEYLYKYKKQRKGLIERLTLTL